MSKDIVNYNKVISFDGSKAKFSVWKAKTKARAKRRGYAKLLTGQEKNPTASEIEKASKGTSKEDKKLVQLGELNELAYEDLILAINADKKEGLVVFNIVNSLCVSCSGEAKKNGPLTPLKITPSSHGANPYNMGVYG